MCGGKLALEHEDYIPYKETEPQYTEPTKDKKIIENQLSKSDIKKIFYDPKTGLISLDKFYKKLKKIDPDIQHKDIENFYNKQEINQIFKRLTKPRVYNSVYANFPRHIYQIDFVVYNRFEINHYSYIFVLIYIVVFVNV
jgi:hypothetical protein